MLRISLLEEMMNEQRLILGMGENPCNKAKLEGIIVATEALGYDVILRDGKFVIIENHTIAEIA